MLDLSSFISTVAKAQKYTRLRSPGFAFHQAVRVYIPYVAYLATDTCFDAKQPIQPWLNMVFQGVFDNTMLKGKSSVATTFTRRI